MQEASSHEDNILKTKSLKMMRRTKGTGGGPIPVEVEKLKVYQIPPWVINKGVIIMHQYKKSFLNLWYVLSIILYRNVMLQVSLLVCIQLAETGLQVAVVHWKNGNTSWITKCYGYVTRLGLTKVLQSKRYVLAMWKEWTVRYINDNSGMIYEEKCNRIINLLEGQGMNDNEKLQ